MPPSPSATTRRSPRRSRRCSTSAGTRSPGGSARRSTPIRRRCRPAPRGARRSLGPAHRAADATTSRSTSSSASGVWMTAADGRRYLDAYNNVPCVGHGHPRVDRGDRPPGRAGSTPTCATCTTTAIELAERLIATMPPAGLDTVLFVNSGSEANDVAWRLATTRHRADGGALCTAFAYHGVTEATAALSPESWQAASRPDHVETWAPPDRLRGRTSTARRSRRARPAGRARAGAGRGRSSTACSPATASSTPGLRCAGRAGSSGRHAAGGAVDRRRGPGRSRPDRRGDVVVRAARASRPTSSRSASRWATAIRSARS